MNVRRSVKQHHTTISTSCYYRGPSFQDYFRITTFPVNNGPLITAAIMYQNEQCMHTPFCYMIAATAVGLQNLQITRAHCIFQVLDYEYTTLLILNNLYNTQDAAAKLGQQTSMEKGQTYQTRAIYIYRKQIDLHNSARL